MKTIWEWRRWYGNLRASRPVNATNDNRRHPVHKDCRDSTHHSPFKLFRHQKCGPVEILTLIIALVVIGVTVAEGSAGPIKKRYEVNPTSPAGIVVQIAKPSEPMDSEAGTEYKETVNPQPKGANHDSRH